MGNEGEELREDLDRYRRRRNIANGLVELMNLVLRNFDAGGNTEVSMIPTHDVSGRFIIGNTVTITTTYNVLEEVK